ncbi:hypothetical protein AMATHDRAFT_65009, partial [Amanita thiersii Skay4041]
MLVAPNVAVLCSTGLGGLLYVFGLSMARLSLFLPQGVMLFSGLRTAKAPSSIFNRQSNQVIPRKMGKTSILYLSRLATQQPYVLMYDPFEESCAQNVGVGTLVLRI